jgi:hypothetical protein
VAAASVTVQPTDTCNARKRQGEGLCRNRAGMRTTHEGYGRCYLHGGTTPGGVVAAAKQEAAKLGAEFQLEPHDALLLSVRMAAGFERYCAMRVAQLEAEQVVVQHEQRRVADDGTTVTTSTRAELNVWVREHQKAIDQLARIAKVALDAGVDERRLKIEEQLVGAFANAIDSLLTELGVRDHPDAPAATLRCLRLVEAA